MFHDSSPSTAYGTLDIFAAKLSSYSFFQLFCKPITPANNSSEHNMTNQNGILTYIQLTYPVYSFSQPLRKPMMSANNSEHNIMYILQIK